METPKTPAGRLTEQIMMAIHPHIQPGGLNPGETAHYNRAYEQVYRTLVEHLWRKNQESRLEVVILPNESWARSRTGSRSGFRHSSTLTCVIP